MISDTMAPETIRFDATVAAIDRWAILQLPPQASRRLPSRGQVAVRGTLNGHAFATVVEPDGRRGHWIKLEPPLQRRAAAHIGEHAALELELLDEWPEPQVPADLTAALRTAPPAIRTMWREITPMARWEWVRWVNDTRNPATRARRVEVTISKMEGGKRRPCCFDRSACTDPNVSMSGKLRQPD